ncbi:MULTISPECIES: histidine phosphatase family protein [unclassified Herbaspirillum]|uniref:SixA phosphatase family protein n=1 Tax=unclassified Herbaspirillum TaxID=2624150 RepID=UPI001151FB63|nr:MULTISPECIES: histidine phosphatase family protein [unclassified Herbaspirillum]MBB5391208.1 phosphohistidine phosphatase [Herbaspirillum sp. SJZ102]TQK13101.1 phosphohistidine phosphatase SixA [Herbaspirillum sp. SJZ130]TQK15105.1 phosphohistidine phosphatase SixA [Herbaspirillum sp. SJZ106]TWC67452.1 phosphohistidine phosphatase SixA [Herbaspirillum sp. SJZ099]
MDLILWRHAEAELGEPDEGRALTPKGHKQAGKIADWLDRNLPESCRILVSPATRTLQTVEALGRKYRVHPELAPDKSAEDLLRAANWPDSREPVLIIGHQPTLGLVASQLICGQPQEWSLRKANVWWIAQRERGDITTNYLKAVIAPELIASSGKHHPR